MRIEALKYLYDMQQACRLMAAFLAGRSFDDYSTDPLLRSAVERQLTIVGEALNRLMKIESAVTTRITDVRQIIAFRNILVHGYDVVRHEVVWGILESDLSILTRDVDTLLQTRGSVTESRGDEVLTRPSAAAQSGFPIRDSGFPQGNDPGIRNLESGIRNPRCGTAQGAYKGTH